MQKYQKNIAIILVGLTLVSYFAWAQPKRAKALDFDFGSLCTLAGGFSLGNLLDTAINAGISWLENKLSVSTKQDVPVNDKTANGQEQLKNCAQTILTDLANNYAHDFVTRTLSRYHIANYGVYLINLADQVYVQHSISGKSLMDQFLIKQNINNIIRKTEASQNLRIIYNKRSLQVVGFDKARTANVLKDSTLATIDNPLVSTPQGQEYLSQAAAQEVYADARSAATLQILSGQGQKDQFQKTGGQYTVLHPGSYVASTVTTKVNGLLQQDLKPQHFLL